MSLMLMPARPRASAISATMPGRLVTVTRSSRAGPSPPASPTCRSASRSARAASFQRAIAPASWATSAARTSWSRATASSSWSTSASRLAR
ncbi:hypothetical protein C7Y72_17465 [Paraconexibacter algicola]|uniref:Uncharacterized protein n=1 Tax=Paraconexibacter algicola TaxID=2133960 RepID=A0A2T4UD64_9ACTN|nr:hypothetical protein C7Y72_17465 [Paraconexibacter algicola]